MAKKCLWSVDAQGGLTFPLRSRQLHDIYAADSGWERPVSAIVVMVICGILDFVVFKQLFAAILYDQVLVQWLSVVGCLVAFDLAPIYLGILAKKHSQGMRISLFAVALLTLSFLIVLAGNVWLRITVKDILVPPDSAADFSLFGSQETASESSPAALPYALFSSALPLATSIVSFIISYMSSDPLREKVRALHARQIELEDAEGQLEAILVEYEADPDLQARLTEADDAQYATALASADEKCFQYADYVRQRIKEHMGDAAATNVLSKDCREQLCRLLRHIGSEDLPQDSDRQEGGEARPLPAKEAA